MAVIRAKYIRYLNLLLTPGEKKPGHGSPNNNIEKGKRSDGKGDNGLLLLFGAGNVVLGVVPGNVSFTSLFD
jgi:hypothetical protein